MKWLLFSGRHVLHDTFFITQTQSCHLFGTFLNVKKFSYVFFKVSFHRICLLMCFLNCVYTLQYLFHVIISQCALTCFLSLCHHRQDTTKVSIMEEDMLLPTVEALQSSVCCHSMFHPICNYFELFLNCVKYWITYLMLFLKLAIDAIRLYLSLGLMLWYLLQLQLIWLFVTYVLVKQ